MTRPFTRLAILQYGSPGVRMVQAVREVNHEEQAAIRTVALATDGDRRGALSREADELVVLEPPTSPAHADRRPLELRAVEAALVEVGADALWGALELPAAYQAELTELCERLGVVFVGPPADVTRRLLDDQELSALAGAVGLPGASAPAAAWGCPSPGTRHLDVEVIADERQGVWAFGPVDVTLRHEGQALLAEAPALAVPPDRQEAVRQAAVGLAASAGYRGAGRLSFCYDQSSGSISLAGADARVRPGHAVIESVTGVDLVKLQLQVARGKTLDGPEPTLCGYAAGTQVQAEGRGSAPGQGRVALLRPPTGVGVRVDTGVAEGDAVLAADPTLLAVTAWGRQRDETLSRLRRSLAEAAIVVAGMSTNRAFLLELLDRPEVRDDRGELRWLEAMVAGGTHPPAQYADVALLAVAIEAYDLDAAEERRTFHLWAARGRPRVSPRTGARVEVRHAGGTYRLTVYRLGPHRYRVVEDGTSVDVNVERRGPLERRLACFGRHFRVVSVTDGLDHVVEVEGIPHRFSQQAAGTVEAPVPAVIVSIDVQPGDEVVVGHPLAVLETMKMELTVTSPVAGRVRSVEVTPNAQVEAGAPLLYVEPVAPIAAPAAERIVLGRSQASPVELIASANPCADVLEALRCQMLGFDVDPRDRARLSAEQLRVCGEAVPDDAQLARREDQILDIFVDICSLSRRDPEAHELVGEEVHSPEEYLLTFLRALDRGTEGFPRWFLENLTRTLAHYGVHRLERSAELEESLFRIHRSQQRMPEQLPAILSILDRRLEHVGDLAPSAGPSFRTLLDRMVRASQHRYPAVAELAGEVRYRYFEQPVFEEARDRVYREMQDHLSYLATHPDAPDREERILALVACPQPLKSLLTRRALDADRELRCSMLEVLTRRYYRIRHLESLTTLVVGDQAVATAEYDLQGSRIHVLTSFADYRELDVALQHLLPLVAEIPADHDVMLDLYVWRAEPASDPEATEQEVAATVNRVAFPRLLRRVVVAVSGPGRGLGMGGVEHFTYRPGASGYVEDTVVRDLHPMMAARLHLWRLANFSIQRLRSIEDVYLFRGVARENPKDERLFALAEIRDLTPVRDGRGRVVQLPHLERMSNEAFAALRAYQSHLPPEQRLQSNRVLLYVWPVLDLSPEELHTIVERLAPATANLGLEKVDVLARMPSPAHLPHATEEHRRGEPRERVLTLSNPGGTGVVLHIDEPLDRPIRPLTEYRQKVVQMRRRGLVYPYEIVRMLTPEPGDIHSGFPPGEFVEYDFDEDGALAPVDRPWGRNTAHVVVGMLTNYTPKYPEGMSRVIVLGDPSKSLGSVAEPECARIIAALDLAEERNVPLEWFTHCSGAKIAMDSGTENMDWVARLLRRLIEYTQAGREVNCIVVGINVGAQPYWNAEATMLMHTRGILIMTSDGAMVLTGKHALDYSGGVSAEDNFGIGGYDRVMGPNGQAQYWAADIPHACRILLHHYDHTYVAPGERFPRRAPTSDPIDRDVRSFPHPHDGLSDFRTIGDVFSEEHNPERKKPFDIRTVMRATMDQDAQPLERWAGMADADTGVVWDAHLGGQPVCLLGFECHPITRTGFVPADGPELWTSGTLFPKSSKKIARAINSASGNRPVVVLANLAGFDGSPESMRELQLEYGAEIGRAVTNFVGPIVFCVISRYHGGAFVVFSNALNDNLEVAALEGSYASVIGGAPAAAVVFARDVDRRTDDDPRVAELAARVADATGTEKARLREQLAEVRAAVRSEKLGEVADEFDAVHTVQRAQRVGSVHRIIPAGSLRPYVIDAVERGVARELARVDGGSGGV